MIAHQRALQLDGGKLIKLHTWRPHIGRRIHSTCRISLDTTEFISLQLYWLIPACSADSFRLDLITSVFGLLVRVSASLIFSL